jgi:hypothetical protein
LVLGRDLSVKNLVERLSFRQLRRGSKSPLRIRVALALPALLALLTIRTTVCIARLVPSTRDVRIEIRLKPRENRAWRAAAKRADMTLSEWIRHMCGGSPATSDNVRAR